MSPFVIYMPVMETGGCYTKIVLKKRHDYVEYVTQGEEATHDRRLYSHNIEHYFQLVSQVRFDF